MINKQYPEYEIRNEIIINPIILALFSIKFLYSFLSSFLFFYRRNIHCAIKGKKIHRERVNKTSINHLQCIQCIPSFACVHKRFDTHSRRLVAVGFSYYPGRHNMGRWRVGIYLEESW